MRSLLLVIMVMVLKLELLLLMLNDATVDLVGDYLLVDALRGNVVVVVGQHEQESKNINLLL